MTSDNIDYTALAADTNAKVARTLEREGIHPAEAAQAAEDDRIRIAREALEAARAKAAVIEQAEAKKRAELARKEAAEAEKRNEAQRAAEAVRKAEVALLAAEAQAEADALAAERIAWENDPANTGWLEAHVARYERHLAQEKDRYLLLQEVWAEFVVAPCPPRSLWKVSDAETKWSGTFWGISFQVTLDIVTKDHMIYVQTMWPQTLGNGPDSWTNVSFMLERSTLHYVGEKFVNGGGVRAKFEQMIRGES